MIGGDALEPATSPESANIKSRWSASKPFARTAGGLAAASPLSFLIAGRVHGEASLLGPSWVLVVAIAASASMWMAAHLLTEDPRRGRVFLLAAVCSLFALSGHALLDSPALALAALLAALGWLSPFWVRGLRRPGLIRRPFFVGRARGASISAALISLVVFETLEQKTPIDLAALGMSLAIGLALVLVWMKKYGAAHKKRMAIIAGAIALEVLLVATEWGDWTGMVVCAAIVPAISIFALPLRRRTSLERGAWWEPILSHPERLLGATFAALCALGAMLLALPASLSAGKTISAVDALFTAVSAVCINGLIVLDTASHFSGFGELVILLLIQVGALGIMTFSTAGLSFFVRRLSLRHERAVALLISPDDRGRIFSVTRDVIIFTAITELAGALVLAVCFWVEGDSLAYGAWRALFTSVSAFCNAGFALQVDSLVLYQSNPVVLHTIALLIIVGGLSPVAVLAIPALLRRRGEPVRAGVKIILVSAVVLTVLGFVAFLAMEWSNVLRGMSLADRLHNAWFQSVTLRSAGFNSVALTELRPATISLMMVWMFIGGSHGSTAGGIKTTTLAVLILAAVAAVRGHAEVTVFGRRIPHRTIYKAAAIVIVAAAGVFAALVAVQVTQDMPTLLAFFEVVSALGTVGLSVGGTSLLDGVGKVVIISCMFIGRIGTLTLFMFLSRRAAFAPSWLRPEEEVGVG
jgi:trk system potassium uptake protein TrkH